MKQIGYMILIGLAVSSVTGCTCKKAAVKGPDDQGKTFNWPVVIPPQHQPEQFKAIFQKAVQEANAKIELVGFDCRFPPCIAQFLDPGSKMLEISQTPTFKKNFPVNTMTSEEVDCGPAGIERASFLTGWFEGSGAWERMKELAKTWHCASGKTAAQIAEEQDAAPAAPVPWPDNIPAQYKQEGFEAIVKQAIEQIQLKVELVGFDCQELPCIAIMRSLPDNQDNITSAPVWQENFGGAVWSGYQGEAGYGECTKDRIALASAPWDGKNDPKAMSPEDYQGSFQALDKNPQSSRVQKNAIKRIRERWEVIRKAWKCAAPK